MNTSTISGRKDEDSKETASVDTMIIIKTNRMNINIGKKQNPPNDGPVL